METGTPAPALRRLPRHLRHTTDRAACSAFASDRDTPSGPSPIAVVQPRDGDEVQSLVAWAHRTGTPLVPVSSTGPRRRGDTVPARAGSVIADLSGLQRLVHADSRDKIVILEPGVDFGTVDTLLAPHGLRAHRPLAPRNGKSVLASHLEREPLIAAHDHWDAGDPFGGTRLVLGDGRIALTGTAAQEGRLEDLLARGHRQMVPVGPANLDLLRVVQGAQGSLALMTWAAVYCERIPALETARFCSADDLAPLIALATELLRRRLGNALFIVDRVQLALLLAPDAAAFDTLCAQLPAWTLFVGLAAGCQRPAEKMAWQLDDLQACARSCGVPVHEHFGPAARAEALNGALRSPQPVPLRERALGELRELFFVQQLGHADTYVRTVRAALGDRAPLGVYLQPMAQGVSCHLEFTLPRGSVDAAAPRIDDERWFDAARRCADAGAFFSRPHGRWADLAFARDEGHRALMTMSKTLLDPKGVLNPGRLPY